MNSDLLDSDLVKLFQSYSSVSDKNNFIMLNNLLILIYLKIFRQKYFDRGYFYYMFFYDFRGRKYYDTLIGISSFKLARFYSFYGYYSKFQIRSLIFESLATRSYSVISSLFCFLENISKVHHSFFKVPFDFMDIRDSYLLYQKSLLTVLFISIGVIFKTKLLAFSSDGYTLTNEVFFKKGLFEYNLYIGDPEGYFEKFSFDIEDYFKLKIFFKFIHKGFNIYKRAPIGLDFSCSGHQLRYLYTGFINADNLKYINLAGDDSCVDFYSLILVTFKKELENFCKGLISEKSPLFQNVDGVDFLTFKKLSSKHFKDFSSFRNLSSSSLDLPFFSSSSLFLDDSAEDDFEKFLPFFEKNSQKLIKDFFLFFGNNVEFLEVCLSFFSRNFLKRSIMTCEYNASCLTFIDYFEDALKKSDKHYLFYLSHKSSFGVLLVFLYRLSKNFSLLSGFSCKRTMSFVYSDVIKKNYLISTFDGFLVNLAVFKRDTADKRVYFKKWDVSTNILVRLSYSLVVYSNVVSDRDTELSFNPNFVHSIDASVVRLIILQNNRDYAYYSVHDEFWVPLQEVLVFKDLVNIILRIDFFCDISFVQLTDSVQNLRILLLKKEITFCYHVIF